jgi:hypothetical protein
VRAGSLLTRVQRVEGVLSPPGNIISIRIHACQPEALCIARAHAALGRPWRDRDVLVLISMQGPCPAGPHAHEEPVIVSPRNESRKGS